MVATGEKKRMKVRACPVDKTVRADLGEAGIQGKLLVQKALAQANGMFPAIE
jgi:hypothetical protein